MKKFALFAAIPALLALSACSDGGSSSGPNGGGIDACMGSFPSLPSGWTASGYAALNPDLANYFCGGSCTTVEQCAMLADHWINNGQAENRSWQGGTQSSEGGSSQGLSSDNGGSQGGFSSSSAASGSGTLHGATGQQVMTWVAPYNHDDAVALINANSAKFAKGLTRVGLQYWVPTTAGGVAYHSEINDSKVNAIVSWAHGNHIAVLLCVYNGQYGWDWNLASSAFKAGNGETFANALVAEMDRMGLDGVDIDFEGNDGNHSEDRSAFATFISALASKLRAKGKILTVDTFHSTCWNAPNVSWWGDWAGKVHNIHSMGYNQLFEGDVTSICADQGSPMTNAFRYSTQQRYGTQAGLAADVVLMGMPGWVETWGSGGQGATITAHLAEVAAINTGIAIWSIDEFSSSGAWVSSATWDAIAAFKGDACGFGNDADCTW